MKDEGLPQADRREVELGEEEYWYATREGWQRMAELQREHDKLRAEVAETVKLSKLWRPIKW